MAHDIARTWAAVQHGQAWPAEALHLPRHYYSGLAPVLQVCAVQSCAAGAGLAQPGACRRAAAPGSVCCAMHGR